MVAAGIALIAERELAVSTVNVGHKPSPLGIAKKPSRQTAATGFGHPKPARLASDGPVSTQWLPMGGCWRRPHFDQHDLALRGQRLGKCTALTP